MPISLTGTYNNIFKIQKTGFKGRSGFTLFELVIVIFIISLTSAIIMPSFWDSGERALKAEAKRTAGTLRYIYDEAAGKKQTYVLTFNIDKGFWGFKSHSETRIIKLKDSVLFKDITVPSLGNVSEGEVIMEFGPLGPAEPVTIHLMKNDAEYTIIFNHISGRAKIYDDNK